jgi:hypothetical protein
MRKDHVTVFQDIEVRWKSRGKGFPRVFEPREELQFPFTDNNKEIVCYFHEDKN